MTEHYLASYLEETLPSLGLDYETYGPYVTGLFPIDEDGADADDEGIDDIVQLLQSSSETHADDDEVWQSLQKEILKRKKEYDYLETRRKEDDAISGKKIALEKARQALESAKIENTQNLEKKQRAAPSGDDAKRIAALVEQYGYADPDEDKDESSAKKKKGAGDETVVNDNRENARQLEKARTANVRHEASKAHQVKLSAREATKQQKADKIKAKEERRKKASKGERKR
eukprot:CAMPEP_0172515784 /NCGR_PEP_ID=MMETSP1066-20121228/270531_1 /TAXON_ID=671091 /ORGANISM="Coscinodiscus wailesii, Strain CCMP2513" /LENGTH=229 /DNA_ID=CAMNT_0013296961 /DNA_START=55 /DNA_END=744 /DNA_ORIENTATION=-